ncbi:MAG TPA: hypothetical protein VKC66_18775 [Xanthobacteraceae bacterium]|nr:hypothetical protein [Xanthobacteraceae bacterium]
MKIVIAGSLALGLATNIAQPHTALAWGDDGHKVVALIAPSFLEADVLKRVDALLAADTDAWTYALLSEPSSGGSYGLSDKYVKTATADVAFS